MAVPSQLDGPSVTAAPSSFASHFYLPRLATLKYVCIDLLFPQGCFACGARRMLTKWMAESARLDQNEWDFGAHQEKKKQVSIIPYNEQKAK